PFRVTAPENRSALLPARVTALLVNVSALVRSRPPLALAEREPLVRFRFPVAMAAALPRLRATPSSDVVPVRLLAVGNFTVPPPANVRPAVPLMVLLMVVVPVLLLRTPSWAPRSSVATEMVLPVEVPPVLAIMPLLTVNEAPPILMPSPTISTALTVADR